MRNERPKIRSEEREVRNEGMTAAYLHAINDLRVEQTEVPRLEDPQEVLIRIKAVGVCGSDIHFYREGRIGPYIVEKPVVLGHECSGEIVEVGKAVTNVRPGDRVAIEAGVPCRRCWFCKSGRYNLCATVPFMGTPPTDGAFREYVVWPSDFVFPVPNSVSFEEGAMTEPLAVGMQAAKRGKIHPSMKVAVIGAGPIGLTTLQAAAAHGATTVMVSDVSDSRLQLAQRLGATHAINAKQNDAIAAVKDLTVGLGADVVLETAGTPATIQQALAMVRRGGVVVLVGMSSVLEFPIEVMDIIVREYDVRGVFRYCNAYPPALALIASGKVNVKALITHTFPLAQTKEALELADTRKDVAMKVIVKC